MRTLIAFLVAPLTTLLPVVTSPSDWGFFVFITFFIPIRWRFSSGCRATSIFDAWDGSGFGALSALAR
jgi:hypothetical protein